MENQQVKLHPVKPQPEGSPGHIILSKEPILQVVTLIVCVPFSLSLLVKV